MTLLYENTVKPSEAERKFNLNVGDIVTARDERFSAHKTFKWIVTAIYPHIFVCKRLDSNHPHTKGFSKADLHCGLVQKVNGRCANG